MSKPKRILIIAGEVSGDMHAAKLVSSVKSALPDVEFFGMGGFAMRQAGVETLVDMTKLAITGALEVLTNLPTILKAMSILKDAVRKRKPELVILVDYPGFNLRFAKFAKSAGCKVLYYISPQLWAWHTSRVKIVRKYVDKMAVILPFEVDFYKQHGIAATFVGHPLATTVQPTMSVVDAKQQFGLDASNRVIGLFPGSRYGEIKRLLPVMVKSAEVLTTKYPKLQFVLPLASSLEEDDVIPYFENSEIDVRIIEDNLYNVIQVCDAIIATSGTVTLEIGLLAVPMVIVYKFFPPYFPLNLISKVPFIGICNIIAGKEVIKEFLQQHVNSKNICAEITHILDDKNYNQQMRNELAAIKRSLALENVADLTELICQMAA